MHFVITLIIILMHVLANGIVIHLQLTNSLVFCYNTCLYVMLVIGCSMMHVLTFYVPLLL